jgi:hypothetical protein
MDAERIHREGERIMGDVTFVHTSDWEFNDRRSGTKDSETMRFSRARRGMWRRALEMIESWAECPPRVLLLAGDLMEGWQLSDEEARFYGQVLDRLVEVARAGTMIYYSLASHDEGARSSGTWEWFFDHFPGRMTKSDGDPPYDVFEEEDHVVVALGGWGGNADRFGNREYWETVRQAMAEPALQEPSKARFLVTGSSIGISPAAKETGYSYSKAGLPGRIDYAALGGYQLSGAAGRDRRIVERDLFKISVQGVPFHVHDKPWRICEFEIVVGQVHTSEKGAKRVEASLVCPSVYLEFTGSQWGNG